MTEFTKEQLTARAQFMVRKYREMLSINPDYDGIARDVELFVIALAALTTEPVGEVALGEYDGCGCHPDARVVCIAADGQADWENFRDGTRLYTAPAATVSVPDLDTLRLAFEAVERESDHGFNPHKYGIGYADQATQARWESWLACRAAMLQGAEPVQEWIPCSERMPEIEGHYLVWVNASNLDGYCDHQEMATYQGGEWSNEFNWLVTHWMPLPAAPQQEVKK